MDETETHTQDEWDSLEREKLKQKKAEKTMTYSEYRRSLMFRNLSFNFKANMASVAKAVAPTLKKRGENAAANADSLIDAPKPTATKPKKK